MSDDSKTHGQFVFYNGEERTILNDEHFIDQELPFVIFVDANGVESAVPWTAIGAVASVLSFMFDRFEADGGDRQWGLVLKRLSRIEKKLIDILEEIKGLKPYISRRVSEERERQDATALVASIKSYLRSYPGFHDEEWTKDRTHHLLQSLDNTAYMVEQNGLQYVTLMAKALMTHHDLFFFNKTPLAARKTVFEAYVDYFKFSVNGKPGSLDKRLAEVKSDLVRIKSAIQKKHRELKPGTRQVSVWRGFGWTSGRCSYASTVSCYALVRRVPGHSFFLETPKDKFYAIGSSPSRDCERPDRDHRLQTETETEIEVVEKMAFSAEPFAIRGQWTAASGSHCHGPMSGRCSTLFGDHFEPFERHVASWNKQMTRLYQEQAELTMKEDSLQKLVNVAKKSLEFAKRWRQDPEQDPPKKPEP
ncbi:hypothetical protein G6O69_27145 [Pseudenhygromyxa sp. WMMC2535]|uniref:hypothetical protein n=1 Tax=Pseudenhygromyxa sp. WMMC2535 TaxID=2712867 RepID=UPI0015552341|nr:hypothetical protein [Pseudenhygromyxa sp. WMMC2535]NVB41545.1 hypothetical protein [Pseudenhygromyxa sp. WMMC2535]